MKGVNSLIKFKIISSDLELLNKNRVGTNLRSRMCTRRGPYVCCSHFGYKSLLGTVPLNQNPREICISLLA